MLQNPLFLLVVSDELLITYRNEESSSLMQISLSANFDLSVALVVDSHCKCSLSGNALVGDIE